MLPLLLLSAVGAGTGRTHNYSTRMNTTAPGHLTFMSIMGSGALSRAAPANKAIGGTAI